MSRAYYHDSIEEAQMSEQNQDPRPDPNAPIHVPAGADWREPSAADQRRLEFSEGLRGVINRFSRENASDTPDFILADYLSACLDAYGAAAKARDKWFGFDPWQRTQPAVAVDAR